MDKYIFLTVGVPACGKSSYYMKIANDNDWGMGTFRAYISSDDIREELFGHAYDQSDNTKVFEIFKQRADEYLSLGSSVYLDATHRERSWREYAFDLAKKHDAVVVALYFDVPFWTLYRRDRNRSRHVGFKTLLKYFFKLQLPTRAEGFNAVFRIDRNGEYTEMEF